MVAAEEMVNRAVGGQCPWLSSLRAGGRNALEMRVPGAGGFAGEGGCLYSTLQTLQRVVRISEDQ